VDARVLALWYKRFSSRVVQAENIRSDLRQLRRLRARRELPNPQVQHLMRNRGSPGRRTRGEGKAMKATSGGAGNLAKDYAAAVDIGVTRKDRGTLTESRCQRCFEADQSVRGSEI
jgi:hypothetical protein